MPYAPAQVVDIVTDTDPTVQVAIGAGVVAIAILNSAAAAATLELFDGTADTDKRIFFAQAPVNASEGIAGARLWFKNGLFAKTTGAGSSAQVGFE